MTPDRSLLFRSNRSMGASLVGNGLISTEDLNTANRLLMDLVEEGNLKRACLMSILLDEMEALKEADVINHIVENFNTGLIDLQNYDLEKSVDPGLDLGSCWSTWTLPFNKEDNFHFVTTAYYLSATVLKYWEGVLEGNLVWYISPLKSIYEALGKIEALIEDETKS